MSPSLHRAPCRRASSTSPSPQSSARALTPTCSSWRPRRPGSAAPPAPTSSSAPQAAATSCASVAQSSATSAASTTSSTGPRAGGWCFVRQGCSLAGLQQCQMARVWSGHCLCTSQAGAQARHWHHLHGRSVAGPGPSLALRHAPCPAYHMSVHITRRHARREDAPSQQC